MADTELARDTILNDVFDEIIRHRRRSGWRMKAIEWERGETITGATSRHEPVPYGLRVSSDCQGLQIDSSEMEVLTVITEMIIHERPLTVIADALNERNLRDRGGRFWTPNSVFQLMPRVIDSSRYIFNTPEWPQRRAAART